jgi:hypothetical protein
MTPLQKSLAAASLVIGFSVVPAAAAVIDFTGLVDLSNYSQNGLDMTSNSVWNYPGLGIAHMDGGVATFKLTSLGDFSLTSVFFDPSGGDGPARFTAFNNGNNLGFVDIGGNAGVYNFAAPFASIDEFQISFLANHFSFDDINFTPKTTPGRSVPDGSSSIVLLGLAMSAVAGAHRKFRG